jgi:lipoprotein-anchoring transpeptidase ErfK/SrfK
MSRIGRKTRIGAIVAVLVLVFAAAGAYAYDSTQKDKIADGVTIAGVDVGGLNSAEATAAVRRQLVAPLRHSLEVTYRGHAWTLSGTELKLRADIDAAVEQALDASQEGGIPDRLVRYVSGGTVDDAIPAEVTYSHQVLKRFVRHVTAEVGRKPEDASVNPSGDTLEVVHGEDGRKLRANKLTEELERAVLSADAPRTILASVRSTQPKVTSKDVAAEYPSYLTLDRATFTLRLWQHLKLAKTYTVAVGQEGLETPEGLYEIQEKEENPTWHVPESSWAGDLAGATIPPGPENPIKARWMGIFEGAGIHGTEETESLGTAASHGCVRMAIPDVEELYDLVEVGTPIFIG